MTNTTQELILNNPLGGTIFYPLPSLASEKKCIRDTYRIRHPVFAIRIVFVTWCIRSSPSCNVFHSMLLLEIKIALLLLLLPHQSDMG